MEPNTVVRAGSLPIGCEPVEADQAVAGDPHTGVAELGRYVLAS